MAKKLDEQQKRCTDCIYLKKVKDLNAEWHFTKFWICSACNIEIHHITDNECHVLSENYEIKDMNEIVEELKEAYNDSCN